MSEPIHVISLGAGVQSSTMALMAAKGEITPMPTAAVFADTQDEPQSVYRWLDWLSNNFHSEIFLHRSCVPLDQVDFSTDGERGQGLLWGNECEGMCGV